MTRLFLIGGGSHEASYVRTFWRFVDAATQWGDDGGDDHRSIAIVIAAEPDADKAALEAQYRAPFELFDPVEARQCHVLFASAAEPLDAERLAAVQPTGVFIAGGRTGLYHDALCRDLRWADYVRQHALPYAGYSAGAVIAAPRAVMGGWLLALQHCNAEVGAQSCSEGIDFTELRDGLGLAPFAIEAHATQWGTLTRLVQLVAEGALEAGWAIDENCMVEIDGDVLRVCGANCAYRVRRAAGRSVQTDVFRAGTVLTRAHW
jgi:cyanophycinase